MAGLGRVAGLSGPITIIAGRMKETVERMAHAMVSPMQMIDREGLGGDGTPCAPDRARAYVHELATSHYENFPVLTRLVPSELRDDFAAVYAFCRWSDDLGDETGAGEAARARSLDLLRQWRAMLDGCVRFARGDDGGGQGAPSHPVYAALAGTIRKNNLSDRPFHHLIDAFEQDQRVTRYETWEQVLDYCTRSADPVGRIVLALAGVGDGGTPQSTDERTTRLVKMSDATCTALQLINFWQDVRRDLLERDRVYLPSGEVGFGAEDLRAWIAEPDAPEHRVRYIKAVRPLVKRTGALFEEGRPLAEELPPSIAPVVRLFWEGGMTIVHAVERQGCTTLWRRPRLGKAKKASLVLGAMIRAKLARRREAA